MITGKQLVAAKAKSNALDLGGFARLVLKKRDGTSIVVSLRHRTNLVGSAEGCRVRLRSDDIAPLHAVITRDPTGLQIRRLAPDGRLELNQESIDVSYLRDGDRIRVGPIAMELSTNVKPVDSKTLLQDFAQHIKTKLNIDPADYADMRGPSSNGQSSDTEKSSEAVHRWQQLSEQLQEQERLLGQVERRMSTGNESADPRVRKQVQELSELHERIRNEISVLRLWLKPKETVSVDSTVKVESTATKKTEEPYVEPVPQPERRSKVFLKSQVSTGPGTVAVDDYTCDECCGIVFQQRAIRWFEFPAWLAGFRGIQCAMCELKTLQYASKISPLDDD